MVWKIFDIDIFTRLGEIVPLQMYNPLTNVAILESGLKMLVHVRSLNYKPVYLYIFHKIFKR